MNLENYVLDFHSKVVALRDEILIETNKIRARLLKTNSTRTIAELRAENLTAGIAPKVITITDSGKQGVFYLDSTDSSTVDNTGMCIVTAATLRYKRPLETFVNVKWFGAKGDGSTNDAPAIQAAIDWAKAQLSANGGNIKVNVHFPSGSYVINTTLNATSANGIWLTGQSSRYENTTLDGHTGGVMVDFSGSTMSGCSNLTFFAGTTGTPSTIGALFAFDGSGGLNCGIRNCFFLLQHNATANNGLGTIGILNAKSEEFTIWDCLIRANSCVIFTSNAVFSTNQVTSFTATSAYTNISGSGSMGVIDIGGTTSLQSHTHTGHPLTLYGVNSLRCHTHIYAGGDAPVIGNEDAGIGIYQVNYNLKISGTLEGSYSMFSLEANGKLHNSEINFAYANMVDKTKPVGVLGAGSDLMQSKITCIFGNGTLDHPSNKHFLYSPVANGDTACTAYIRNCEIMTPVWNYPSMFISPALLKNVTGNSKLGSGGQANWVENEERVLGFSLPRTLGTTNGATANLSTNVARFMLCDKTTTTSGNGGSYTVKIAGTVNVGTYSASNPAMVSFQSTIVLLQKGDSTQLSSSSTTLITSKSISLATYSDITSVTADITTSGPYGVIRLFVTTTGTSTGDSVLYKGKVSIIPDFAINSTQLFD